MEQTAQQNLPPLEPQDIVPLPDRRSIRRITLSRKQIDKFYVQV